MLLPDIYDMEVTRLLNLRDISSGENILNILPPWLSSQLSSMLDFYVAYQCSIKKYATVVFNCGGDLIHVLNTALGQLRFQQ